VSCGHQLCWVVGIMGCMLRDVRQWHTDTIILREHTRSQRWDGLRGLKWSLAVTGVQQRRVSCA
jgi:hypothetical protein